MSMTFAHCHKSLSTSECVRAWRRGRSRMGANPKGHENGNITVIARSVVRGKGLCTDRTANSQFINYVLVCLLSTKCHLQEEQQGTRRTPRDIRIQKIGISVPVNSSA